VTPEYLPSFIRDLKALKKTPIYPTLKQIAFEEIPAYQSIDQIPNLKKLKCKAVGHLATWVVLAQIQAEQTG